MVNPNADAATQKGQALMINTNAAKGLAEVPDPVSNSRLRTLRPDRPSGYTSTIRPPARPHPPPLVSQVLRTNLGPSGTMKM